MPSFPTNVLYLHAGDRREDILRQLAIARAEQRVLLVFPARPISRLNLLDFQLLARQAERTSIALAIATRSPMLRTQAENAGLLVFSTITKARQHSWQKPDHEKQERQSFLITPGRIKPRFMLPAASWATTQFRSHPHAWWEWVVFIFAIAAMLGVILYLSSSARITIPLRKETQSLQVTFIGKPEVLSANLTGQFPVHDLNLILEAKGSAPATGRLDTPQDYAHGTVSIRNLTTTPLTVPRGLVVATLGESPVRFETTREITLPANAAEASEVSIRAILPGTQGNVSANAIQAIEGSLGASLAVSNGSPLFGGTDIRTATPTDNDIHLLKTALLNQLEQQAKQDFIAQLNPGSEFLVEESVTRSEIIVEEIIAQTGSSMDEFTLSLRVRYTVSMVSTDDLTNIAEQLLSMNLPSLKIPLENTIRIDPAASPVMQNDEVVWDVILQQQVYDQLDPEMLTVFAGKPRAHLLQWMDTHLSLSGKPTIISTPRGWLWMPIFIKNMEIILI